MSEVEAFRAERAERDLPRIKAPCYLQESAAPVDMVVTMAMSDVRLILASAYHEALGICKLPQRCRRCSHELTAHGGDRGAGCQLCGSCTSYAFIQVKANSPMWQSLLASRDPEVADNIEHLLWKAQNVIELALDPLDGGGKLLLSACPWCNGENEAMPRGSLSLRVFVPGVAPDTYVLCMNSECRPTQEACGSRYRGRPMWPFHELGWLADQIDATLARKVAEAVLVEEIELPVAS